MAAPETDDPPASTSPLERRTFLIALVAVTIAFAWLLRPFVAPLLWAGILAVLFHPVQARLERRWGHRPGLVALVTLAACVLLVIVPVLLLLTSFVRQGIAVAQSISAGEIQPGAFLDRVRSALPGLPAVLDWVGIDMETVRRNAASAAVAASQFAMQNALTLGLGTADFLLKLALMLYVAFFLIRDGRALAEQVVQAVPLGDQRERLLFQKFVEVARATVKGNLIVALVQGGLGGLIFWILGLPAPLVWTVVMAVLSLIPAVGAGLVWVPAALWLYVAGSWISATILLVYGVVVIGLADNLLRPLLVGRDTKLPDWVVLLSTLGGLAVMGVHGFVVGPLIAVLFVAFWQIFAREFNGAGGAEIAVTASPTSEPGSPPA